MDYNSQNNWVPISSTDKVFDDWIRDLGFNFSAYIKNQSVSWSDDKEQKSQKHVIGWNSMFSKFLKQVSLGLQ